MSILEPGIDSRVLPTQGMTPIRKGDVVGHTRAGADGLVDQLERDPEAVHSDVRNELITDSRGAGF